MFGWDDEAIFPEDSYDRKEWDEMDFKKKGVVYSGEGRGMEWD